MDICAGPLILIFLLIVLAAIAFPVLVSCVKIVRQANVGIIERLGKYEGIREPGFHLLVPLIDRMIIIDMREQVFPLRPQPVITQDNVTMNIDAIIYYQVTDPFRANYEVANLIAAVEQLALTSLRNIVGEMTLDHTLTSRDIINAKLQEILDEATTKWGLKVNRVEVKDINPPRDIEEAMQKQMRAERTKRAAILTAEGEKEAAIQTSQGVRQSAIFTAEGEKQAAILKAEGDKQAAILRAEGEKEATILNAQAEAEKIKLTKEADALMIERTYRAIHNGKPTPELIHIKYLEALEEVSKGQAATLMLPFESSAFMGSLVAAAQGFKIPRPRPGGMPNINPES